MTPHAQKGFSLVEMIVMLGMIGTLSVLLVVNFRSAATNTSARHRVALSVVSDIRRAQSMAIAGSTYNDAQACGFGIHYLNATGYNIFVRTAAGGVSCAADPRPKNFLPADLVIEIRKIQNPAMVFQNTFPDIYFSIPYGVVYLGGIPSSNRPVIIPIWTLSQPSGESISTISVYSSGKIDLTN